MFAGNEDFTSILLSTVALQEEDASITVTVEVLEDEFVEGDELFFVRLVRAIDDTSGVQLSMDTASVIIKDNDCKYRLSHMLIMYENNTMLHCKLQ